MAIILIKRDDSVIGFADPHSAIGALEWFAPNVHAYSMDHAIRHEGYSAETVDEIDCGEVSGYLEMIAKRIGLESSFAFVPLSQSRHAKPGADGKIWQSLNWRVTLKRSTGSKASLVVDYAQGSGNAPASKMKAPTPYDRRIREDAIAIECETGNVARKAWGGQDSVIASAKAIPAPRLGDVLHSLLLDSDVLDSNGFEDWASDLGYDTDSRAAEKTYRECMEQSQKFRAIVGTHVLSEMRLVSQFN